MEELRLAKEAKSRDATRMLEGMLHQVLDRHLKKVHEMIEDALAPHLKRLSEMIDDQKALKLNIPASQII